MCFFISQNKTREFLEKIYGVEFEKQEDYKKGDYISGFSYPELPVVSSTIQIKNWGLIPFWIKDKESAKDIRNKTLNARAETILTKPSFKRAVKSSRCLIPVSGFYEWKHVEGKKYPYFIKLREKEILNIAGIYDNWLDRETGNTLCTFSLITTEANEIMAEIHNTQKRMPMILEDETNMNFSMLNYTNEHD